MKAVLLTGHGGFDKLEYRDDVPIPRARVGEVLVQVRAAGVNNTDINTRTAWYSSSFDRSDYKVGTADSLKGNVGTRWADTPITFPRIQGADCCGYIVEAGLGVDPKRIGERVIIRTMMTSPLKDRPFECCTFGFECDGAFAQYARVPSDEAYCISSGLSDIELASVPCAYSTAENLLDRADVRPGERVLITGASGNVGCAAIQLAKRRRAEVIAVAAIEKAPILYSIGADSVISGKASILKTLGSRSTDVVVDVVAGSKWPQLLQVLRRGGRLAIAGAIDGPLVELDVRTLYLNDLTFFGCTFQRRAIFQELINYIVRGEIRPLVAQTYPLSQIEMAQRDFLSKKHVGKLVLIPDQSWESGT